VLTCRGNRDELVLQGHVAARRLIRWLRPSVFGFVRSATTELPEDSSPVFDGSRLVALLRSSAEGYSVTSRIPRSDGSFHSGDTR